MSSVTIEGSLTPSSFLARGERLTVQRDARVDRLIARGYVVVVDEGTAPAPAPEPAPEDHTDQEPEAVQPPARNASRDDWAEYLAAHTAIVTDGKDRAELIAEYDDLSEE